MTRDEIEAARDHLKTWFPNQSVERHTFNKICDQAVLAARTQEPVAYRWKWDEKLEWHYGEYLSQRDYYASEPLFVQHNAASDEQPKEQK